MAKPVGFIAAIALLLLQSCSSVPITGRSQMNLLPESSMVEMGLSNYGQFLSENKLSTDKKQIEAVNRVGKKIAQAVESYLKQNGFEERGNDFKWEFNVVESNEVNAWCMPGGKVVFYTGILPIAQNDEGIAVVMGHEIAHAVARHGNERMSQQMLVQLGGVALAEAIKQKPAETQKYFLSAYGLGSQVGVVLPFSRKHEYEADKLGAVFMAMAGYNPEETINFWNRMAQQGSSGTPEFLSTHPVSENRIESLKQMMPEALKYYKK